MQSADPLVRTVGGIFLVCGTAVAVVAARHFTRRLAFIRQSAVAQGVIVALREERDGLETQRVKYPRVRFRAASGRDVTFESEMGIGGNALRIGQAVAVRYRPDHPETAELDGGAALWGVPVLFALLAAAFLGIGAALVLGLIEA